MLVLVLLVALVMLVALVSVVVHSCFVGYTPCSQSCARNLSCLTAYSIRSLLPSPAPDGGHSPPRDGAGGNRGSLFYLSSPSCETSRPFSSHWCTRQQSLQNMK